MGSADDGKRRSQDDVGDLLLIASAPQTVTAPALASDGSASAVRIRDLVKRYKNVTAVDRLSFDVAPGEFFGFLGPNGAGKTTTINAIVGLATFQGGAISVFGHDVVGDYRNSRRLVGLSPQEFNFDRYLSIEEILVYQAGYYGIPLREAKPRARALLDQFELTDKRRNSYLELSGGMKRRLSLARALVHNPRLLILDEPTAGMDVELRLELWDFLRQINAQGMTIFMTSHYLEEVEALCNRIGIVNHGRLVTLEDKTTLIGSHGEESLQDIFLALVGRRRHGEGGPLQS